MVTTKEQEKLALEKIRKIVEGLGEGSYVGTAFEGCFELAEENISNDFGLSMKEIAESAVKRTVEAEDKAANFAKELEATQKLVRTLEKELEREQEWKPYVDRKRMPQKEYEELASEKEIKILTDEEAKNLLYHWFGFAKERITIHRNVPVYEINRHGQLRETGKIERLPLYFSSDWYYIRFDCGNVSYELCNDDLNFFG